MSKKQFRTESKQLLDLMVNSIYTNKDIFLREIVSNASDAIDKLYFRSLTDTSIDIKKSDYQIRITADKQAGTLSISDNGCGMTKEDLENDLGTIAKSGSREFKARLESGADVDVIGQFGVGFYSAFMVSRKIVVESRAWGAEEAFRWESSGADGYTVSPCEKEGNGTVVTLYMKEDTDDDKYSEYLQEHKLRALIKKYSDFVRYPIRMTVTSRRLKEGSSDEYETVTEDATLNSITPIWKRPASEVTEEDYNSFYKEKFYDFEDPAAFIKQKTEGMVEYDALLFIPQRAPFDYYTRNYEKGLQLYSSGVLIMDKCSDLLPDYFGFVKGIVDSPDLSLNISREMLQQDRQLKLIAKNLEAKIKGRLLELMEKDREKYEKVFSAFGSRMKYGLYADYGTHKDALQDLVMFRSSFNGENATLKEYALRMKDGQKDIYYAPGDSAEQVSMLPQVEAAVARGYEVFYLCDPVDEFALISLGEYDGHPFVNVCSDEAGIGTEEEKESVKKENEACKDMLTFMKDSIAKVSAVRFTGGLKDHPACISSGGGLSANMEKTLNRMPGSEDEKVKAELVLEINLGHPVADKLKALYEQDRDKLASYSRLLYYDARMISGLPVDDPADLSSLLIALMTE